MNVAHYLANRWVQSGVILKTTAVVTAVPVVIWGATSIEAALRAIFRLGHTLIATHSHDRSHRWKWTKIHAWDAVATAGMAGVSLIPVLGTYKSYEALAKEIKHYVTNAWKLRQLDQQVAASQAEGLYQELMKAEPNVDDLIIYAQAKLAPSQEQLDETANALKGTLIGRNLLHTCCYHLIDKSCRAVKIIAIKTIRVTGKIFKVLFSGRIFKAMGRAIKNTVVVITEAVKQEAIYARDLAEQRGHIERPHHEIRKLSHNDIQLIAVQLRGADPKRTAREVQAMVCSHWRDKATSNIQVQQEIPGRIVPEGAPKDYLHKVKYLEKACKTERAASWIHGGASEAAATYFPPIFPFLEKFDMRWLTQMPVEERQELIWNLSTRLPNLQELCLDFREIEPKMQMMIAVKLARSSTNLNQVTLVNADPRVASIMKKFTGWGCKILVGC